MKILIFGGKGMAGHMMVSYLKKNPAYTVYYTSRDTEDRDGIYLDVTHQGKVEDVVEQLKPDVIINCIGILNEHAENNPELAFQINSVLPHQLAKLAERYGGKLIHISTDCVFSGQKGSYTEKDIPDGTSIYAESKKLGEVYSPHHLTIRTSIIGPELKEDGIGLLLWFMKQKGKIKGYERVLWNGVTTLELAKATESLMKSGHTGLVHLASAEKISKLNLLRLFQQVFHKNDVDIIPDHEIVLDRTIQSTREDFHYEVPDYESMLVELRDWIEAN